MTPEADSKRSNAAQTGHSATTGAVSSHSTFDDVWGGPHFAALIDAIRDIQDQVAAADLPRDTLREAVVRATDLADLLAEWRRPEGMSPTGQRRDLPGRGHPMIPPLHISHLGQGRLDGTVTFSRAHLGNGAVHGGMLSLLFDEALGRCVTWDGRLTRTAHLEIDYRALTPIGIELAFDVNIDRIEGRKNWVSGRLWHGETLLCETRALFIEVVSMRPGLLADNERKATT